ncbi:SEL1-like repeat protein (plasmid) [Rhodobacteraceae bacterium M382]|nr:SEL1-like repeat protein [Rhodobacteraceae bacterium M382]
MPFFHHLTRPWYTALCLGVSLPLTALPALAQSELAQGEQPPQEQSEAAPALPEMAAIEQAWKRGDYVTARAGLAQLAQELGTPLAQYRYGRILFEGRGGPRDIPGAIDWLTRAVAQDHLEAITLLARIHLSGEDLGLQRDSAQAAELLAKAATRGKSEAQYYLGLLSSAGDGLPKDETAAVNWFLAAAEQQHVEAQYALSRAYSKGAGVEVNTQKALKWLTRAAENGHTDAQFFLANAYDGGKGAPNLPGEALAWYRRAAENGHILAARVLGTKYMQGDGVTQNMTEALRWLVPAAQAGEPGAMSNLGYIYTTGAEGVPPDEAKALYWYEQAAEYGVSRAMLILGQIHETGRGTPVDPARAMALYRQALSAGQPKAAEQLTRMQLAGKLDALAAPQEAVAWMAVAARDGTAAAQEWLAAQAVDGNRPARTALALVLLAQAQTAPETAPQKTQEAAALLLQAAEAGDARAQAELGQLYTTGTGVSLDYVNAHKWLNVAAASGATKAAQQRDTIAKLMTPEQIAQAQTAAREVFEQATLQPPQTQQTVQENN